MALTRRETTILALGDFFLLIVSLWAALALRNLSFPAPGYFEANFLPFFPVFIVSIAVFFIAGLYEKQTRLVRREMGERIFEAQVANSIIAALLFFVLPLSIAPKTILAIYLVVSVLLVSLWHFYRAKRERASVGRISAVLVAGGTAAQEIFEEVNGNDRYLFSFAKHENPSEKPQGVLIEDILKAVQEGALYMIIDTRDPHVAAILPRLYGALLTGVSFIEFSDFYEDVFDRVPLDHIDHAWLLESVPREPAIYRLLKRLIDLACGLTLLIAALPFILVGAVILALSGRRPFLYNERIGKNGARFRLIKLQTMLLNDHGDPELRKQNHVTTFGKFLRMTRIDELPQLLNVVRGDLSFVGPRPELPRIAETYELEIPYYEVRHIIKPGLTGWAQVRHADAPKGEADVTRTRVKLSYDLYYLKRRSLGFDLAIMLKTIRTLLTLSGK